MPSRRPSRQLVHLLDQSPLPIFVVDGERQILYCNPACAAWLGLEPSQLIGATCVYHAGDATTPVGEALAALCPPPAAFHGERSVARILWRRGDGPVEQRAAAFLPLGDADAEGQSILGVLDLAHPDPAPAHGQPDLESSAGLHERLQRLARQGRLRFRLDRLVGDSPAMRRVREQVRLAISGRSCVAIVGPPGSGREHVARTIHGGELPEAAGLLLLLDGHLLDAELLQSSVLAFLRRCQDSPTKQPASILLREADQLSAAAQAELLAFYRVPTFGLRTLATARQSLVQLAEQGEFVAELAFKLSPLEIALPPLRDRREDIPLLVQRFVEELNASGGRQLAGVSPAALDRLAALPWTGNVAELAAVIREACEHVSTVWVGEADLPSRVRAVVAAGAHPHRPEETIQLDEFLLEVERELTERALQRARGNKAKAARMLGVSRARLLRRLAQWGLAPADEETIEFQPLDDEPSNQEEP